MDTPDKDPRNPDTLGDRAKATVAHMTEVVRDGKEQIERLRRIMTKIDNLRAAKR